MDDLQFELKIDVLICLFGLKVFSIYHLFNPSLIHFICLNLRNNLRFNLFCSDDKVVVETLIQNIN